MLGKQIAGFDAGIYPANEDVVEFNFKILDTLALSVGAHELQLCLWDRPASRAGLHQYWR